MGSGKRSRTRWAHVRLGTVGLCLCLSFACLAEDMLTAESFEEQITRGPRLRKKVKIDAEDGYTSAESSAFISMPTILFEKGFHALLPSSKRQLDEIAKAMVRIPTRGPIMRLKEKTKKSPMRILIEGHTCDLGPLSVNQDLSERRARSVRDYLAANGVDASLLECRAWGPERPAVPNTDEAARKKNRRVDFILRWHQDVVSQATTGTRGLIETTTATEKYLEVTFEAYLESVNGRRVTGDAIDVLRTGDGIRIAFHVLEGCHVYVLCLGSQGKAGWVWPADASAAVYGVWCYYESEKLVPGPTKDDFFPLTPPTGQEIAFVIATHGPVKNPIGLPALLEGYGAKLTAQILRDSTGAKDAELHMLVINHQ